MAVPFRACDPAQVSDVVARARADLEAGRPWLARDRLVGTLVHRHDAEVLESLASVHLHMGDLPAAGGLLFVLERHDEAAVHAIAAWRDRYTTAAARFYSLPGPVVRHVRGEAIDELITRVRAEERQSGARAGMTRSLAPDDASGWPGWGDVLLWGVVLATLGLAVLGLVTLARWIV